MLAEQHRADPEFASRILALDVKVIVHRGLSSRFEFAGKVDHFGAAVTLIYKLLKNRASSHRYVLVTQQASSVVSFPDGLEHRPLREDVEELGSVEAELFSIPKLIVDGSGLRSILHGDAVRDLGRAA